MANIDLPGFIMTVFAFSVMVYGGWWYLHPGTIVLRVAGRLSEVSALLDRGEPLPNETQFRGTLTDLNNRLSVLRMESNSVPGFMHQLLCFLDGLTYKFYILWQDIDSFQREVELAMDERQLAALDVADQTPPPSAEPWFFQRLGRIVASLIPQLYVPWRSMNTFQRDVESAMDEQQLATLNAAQNIAFRVLPDTATNTAAPANDVAEPAPPPPAAEL